jgi:cellulose synthase/poly-beta-1,6-N-acetylglucosamine synthase-like glycosyltransferase
MKGRFNDLPGGYVLVTAARDEEQYIGDCIESVLCQRIKPLVWVIVNDASQDNTEKIVKNYASSNTFVFLINKKPKKGLKGFSSKVDALNLGAGIVRQNQYGFIGHLDADITLKPEYYEKILEKFHENPFLGLAGGAIFELKYKKFQPRKGNVPWSVPGAIQVFRRKCYEEIGAFSSMPFGGEDWLAEILAKMNGWQVQSFSELPAFHHKPSHLRRGVFTEAIREGALDYSMGAHPVFEIVKCLKRVVIKPYVLFACIRIYSFILQYLVLNKQYVKPEVRTYLRREQLGRLREEIKTIEKKVNFIVNRLQKDN